MRNLILFSLFTLVVAFPALSSVADDAFVLKRLGVCQDCSDPQKMPHHVKCLEITRLMIEAENIQLQREIIKSRRTGPIASKYLSQDEYMGKHLYEYSTALMDFEEQCKNQQEPPVIPDILRPRTLILIPAGKSLLFYTFMGMTEEKCPDLASALFQLIFQGLQQLNSRDRDRIISEMNHLKDYITGRLLVTSEDEASARLAKALDIKDRNKLLQIIHDGVVSVRSERISGPKYAWFYDFSGPCLDRPQD